MKKRRESKGRKMIVRGENAGPEAVLGGSTGRKKKKKQKKDFLVGGGGGGPPKRWEK